MTDGLTLAALYTLHIFNGYSDDLPFLPLPNQGENKTRKDSLYETLVQGYQDLDEAGFIVQGKATNAMAILGHFLSLYAEQYYHIEIDQNYLCAPDPDAEKGMSILITRSSDNRFFIDYLPNPYLLALLITSHELLQDLDMCSKDYLRSDWQPYSHLLLNHKYGKARSIRFKIIQMGRVLSDHLFFTHRKELFEYDVVGQRLRSVSANQLRQTMIKDMKVRT